MLPCAVPPGGKPSSSFFNPTAFDVADPIFQQDIGFYVFKLPFWEGVQSNIQGALIWALLVAVGVLRPEGRNSPGTGLEVFF